MGMGLFSSEVPIISIEFGNPIRVIYGGRKKDKKVVIRNFAQEFLPPEVFQGTQLNNSTYVLEILRSILKNFRIKSGKTLIAIPAQNVMVRFFSFPYMLEEEIRESIKWELERYVPFAPEDINYDIQIVDVIEREDSKESKVMLVAIPKDVINPYLEIIKNLNLEPELVDVSVFSAVRTLILNKKELPKGNTLYLYSHNNVAEFVVAKENQPLFFRSTIMEEWNPQSETIDDLTKSFMLEDFVRKIQESVNFFYMQFPEEHLDQVWVTGSNSKDKDFVDLLEAVLNVPAEIVPGISSSFDNLLILNLKKQERTFLEDLSSWVVPIGLFFWERL